MLKTRERIITLADLQTEPAVVLQNAQKQPLVVTEGGKPVVYMLSVEVFDELMERLLALEQEELRENILKGEEQFELGDFFSLQEALAEAEMAWQTQHE